MRSLASDIAALLVVTHLPRHLVTSRDHDVLLRHRRAQFISGRARLAAIFLALATMLWIPVDVVLFDMDWAVVLPLAAGRVVAAGLFLAIARLDAARVSARFEVGAVALMMSVGIGFFVFAHVMIPEVGATHLTGAGHAQYVLLPVALVAGLAIFPLTLIEAAALSVLPLLALVVEATHSDGGRVLAQAGVAVFLMCSIMISTATCSISQLQLLADAHEHSTVDPLTGVLSRRAGSELLTIMFGASRRTDRCLSLALIDLDYFKRVNDEFGHEAGDQVLKDVTRDIKHRLRSQDSLIRWGGEEFILALPDTSAAQATALVVELWRSVPCVRPDGTRQTASVGLAERCADAARDWVRLLDLADERMYAAKAHGRARINAPHSVSRPLVDDGSSATPFPSLVAP